jgi:hypothetical protein
MRVLEESLKTGFLGYASFGHPLNQFACWRRSCGGSNRRRRDILEWQKSIAAFDALGKFLGVGVN